MVLAVGPWGFECQAGAHGAELTTAFNQFAFQTLVGRLPTADTKGAHDDFPAGDPCDASKVDMAAGVLLLQAERKARRDLSTEEDAEDGILEQLLSDDADDVAAAGRS